ncbi:unnamed protein product [Cuscuta campestris]|uniref:Uncharacterized protein n=1 Tax=Cuscuta campestris TaxID=132261 RepID=A0A484NQQ8_9ASTE|nr:unnamed protein product [Cuscuta campestris]
MHLVMIFRVPILIRKKQNIAKLHSQVPAFSQTQSTEPNGEPYFLIVFAYSPRPPLKNINSRSSTIEEHTDREKAQLRERKRRQLELITRRIGGGRSD